MAAPLTIPVCCGVTSPGIDRGLGPLGHNMVGRLASHLEAGADKIPPQLAAIVMHPHRIQRPGEASGCAIRVCCAAKTLHKIRVVVGDCEIIYQNALRFSNRRRPHHRCRLAVRRGKGSPAIRSSALVIHCSAASRS